MRSLIVAPQVARTGCGEDDLVAKQRLRATRRNKSPPIERGSLSSGDEMTKTRIPSLDGMRALSIVLVIVSHAQMPLPFVWRFDYGNLGVRVFFVISGFLITNLLLEEREKTGRISIPQFYLRRAFRILPVAYVYLGVVIALIPFGIHAMYSEIAPVALYYANYKYSVGSIVTSHFWSLSVEEQFYFLWPATIVLLGTRRARYACAALLFTAPTFRVLSDNGMWPTNPRYAFESICDALATGCLLAMLRDALWQLTLYRRIVESSFAVVIAAAGVLLTSTYSPVLLRDIIGYPVLNVGVAVALDRYTRLSNETRVGRALNWHPVVWLGTVSYSLYLWQQAWMFSRLPPLLAIAGAIGCATASFYLIERPMLRVRNRISRAFTARPQVRPETAPG